MNCTECKRELGYMEEYLKSPNGDIICGGCRESYALEHTTVYELADYVFYRLLKTNSIIYSWQLNIDLDFADRVGGKLFLDMIKAAGEIPDFIDFHYSDYTGHFNKEADEAMISAWRQEQLALMREYERAAI